ncbi:LytR family transcriptional regulator [Streptomyces ipomoeae]|uniref:LytR family transcriptional regulator n=1 Tax=Streptomyces ipomoeae TaxID=103232 RepID=A0AAE9AWB0_9ACTN|nr:LCP family protein [Streptomyces ipomoeae]TQE16366.1 LytR family transcriptional regulator [Streptomyces ipomoeae]TQE36661.1 LytR family transcriptional regulator [Streptomyces ipomoeae]
MSGGGGRSGRVGPGVGASPSLGERIRRRRWVRWTAGGAAAFALGTLGVAWGAYAKLNGNITSDTSAADELARFEKERPTALVRGAQNILLIGSDSRSGDGNGEYGRDSGTERSDTTILLHLAADRHSATAVSLPRDLMVDVPSCRRRDGSRTEPVFTLFNHAFQSGGSACTIRTVERLTDIRIDHHVVVDFSGFKRVVDAVDGVEVCLATPIHDKAAKLRLPAGKVRLNGEQALGYVRARKSLGDGSDTERMDRQQRFLAALATKVRGNGVLLNPVKLYPLLDAATSSLTTDPGLASLRGLYDLVRGLRTIPMEKVQFLTVPRKSYTRDANRDELVEPAAHRLFERLRSDVPVAVTSELPKGMREGHSAERLSRPPAFTSPDSPSPAPTRTPPLSSDPMPTFRGSTAAEEACE